MPSKGRDNMEKDEEEQSNRTWWRRISLNRWAIIWWGWIFTNVIAGILILLVVFSFFQENKSYGIKTIRIDPLSTRQKFTSKWSHTYLISLYGSEFLIFEVTSELSFELIQLLLIEGGLYWLEQ
jgi:hypothetical protein